MRLIYENVGHELHFGEGYTCELVVENRNLFFKMVNDAVVQAEGNDGGFVLSIMDKAVEFSKYTDVTIQFSPFILNKKGLLTKLYSSLERSAVDAENYMDTAKLLADLETYIDRLGEGFPFSIELKKLSIGAVIRAVAPEIDDTEQSPIEKIFTYMELIRELDRDRIFVMINMRAYFSDEDMERFLESVSLHDFKVLLLESTAYPPLKNVKRYLIDDDLCEF